MMSPAPSPTEARPGQRHCAGASTPDRYQGFALSNVTWGYRDLFEKAIEGLFADGLLGAGNAEVTARFFTLLKQSDQSGHDYFLYRFLGALHPENRWLMKLPGLFSDVVETGAALAATKLHYGLRFFEALAGGGLGATPQTVQTGLTWIRRLRAVDDELAMAFLAGYAHLADRLRPLELERYLAVALGMQAGNPEIARRFVRGELSTSEVYLREITQECRLEDRIPALRTLLKALTDTECEVADLGGLDSDELLEHETQVLVIRGHVYLPARCRRFETTRLNRRWYQLNGVVAAALLLGDSFACIHGHPAYGACADLVGEDPGRINLFQTLEYLRVLRRAARQWPGARRLIAWGLAAEGPRGSPATDPWRLLFDALDASRAAPSEDSVYRQLDACINCFDVAQQLDADWARRLAAPYPALGIQPMRPLSFLSDFQFPVDFAPPPTNQYVADLKCAAGQRHAGARRGERTARPADEPGPAEGGADTQPEEAAGQEAAFVYDEWDFTQNAYRPEWCHVQQRAVPAVETAPALRAEWLASARTVQAVFERIKPEQARREKHLAEGDAINADRLQEYLVARAREPCPPVRFYEKPLIKRRDLAVLLLLDLSGSTGEQLEAAEKVLDVEKQAAWVLGQGLAALGDRFAVCGFSSSGRTHCEFPVFKDFADPWNTAAMGRLMAAWPRGSTRMGPALRHAGYLLAGQPHRRRLIILVTDGRPMDQDYDPVTRYAQHDVRRACEENIRRDIATLALATQQNSRADMEIMFPRGRFAILPDIQRLPTVLPRLYLQLTVR